MMVPEDAESFLRTLFKKGFSSRAFLVCGSPRRREELQRLLVAFLGCSEKTFCKNCTNCRSSNLIDLFRYEGGTLSMDEAHEIHSRLGLHALGEGKIFLLNFRFIGEEVQAVLLKALEELKADTALIVRASSPDHFSLPFLSRLTILRPRAPQEGDASEGSDIHDILKEIASPNLGEVLRHSSLWAGERETCEKVLSAFELGIGKKIQAVKASEFKKLGEFLEDLLETKRRFYAKTYFNRMLLEHLIISYSYLP